MGRWAVALADLGAGVATALLLVLASPPTGLWWLGWFAPLPWCARLFSLAARGTEWRASAFLLGCGQGAGTILLLVPWFAAFSPFGYWASALVRGIGTGLFTLVVAWLMRRPDASRPLLAAAGWTLREWCESQGVTAFPWGQLSATQHGVPVLLQGLDITGAYGLTFLMVLVGAGALGFRTQPVPALLVATLMVGWVTRGFLVLTAPVRTGEKIRVSLIQASESRKAPGAAVVCVSNWEDYAEWSRRALAARPDLLVWPESASVADLAHSPAAREKAVRLLWNGSAHLLSGSFVVDPETMRSQNAAVMLSPTGRVLDVYSKVRIVPFGEYLPWRPLLGWTEALGMPPTDLQAGRSFHPMRWERGTVGTMICFESAFGDISRRMVAGGADLLAVLTSDGWNGRTAAGLQHAAFAPLRAVEVRRSILRAAATGTSQLIDDRGRVIRSLPMFEKGIVTGEVVARSDRTVYAVLGDWPVWMSALLCLAVLRRPRAHREHPPVRSQNSPTPPAA